MEKRTETVAIKIPMKMKLKIQEIAEEKEWTVSHVIYSILKKYFQEDFA